jgi:hypothetical protein
LGNPVADGGVERGTLFDALASFMGDGVRSLEEEEAVLRSCRESAAGMGGMLDAEVVRLGVEGED